MEDTDWLTKRTTAIHLLRSGHSPQEVAQEVQCSVSWVYKWRQRFRAESWAGLADRSRAPHHVANRLPEPTRQAIRRARSELEAAAAHGHGLRYIGAHAIRGRLRDAGLLSLPSTASIERVLAAAGLTRPRQSRAAAETHYPQVRPTQPHQLCQVDIVPHYLRGGRAVACFNALDVVSRYPGGQQTSRKRSLDAEACLVVIWQQLGIAQYTQVDNEACFSGGFTHPAILGRIVRLALYVGTELIFSPVRHPESQGTVERFHQDYNQHVWADTELQDVADVRQRSQQFYHDYQRSRHHSALHGQCPLEVHTQGSRRALPSDFRLPTGKLPLTAGRVHFMRQVSAQRTVPVLNLDWAVPQAQPRQGVWATLELTPPQQATLRIYDAAPAAARRTCLASHPFPLAEPVLPLRPEFRPQAVQRPAGQRLVTMAYGLGAHFAAQCRPFYDVLMACLSVKVPRFSTMS